MRDEVSGAELEVRTADAASCDREHELSRLG